MTDTAHSARELWMSAVDFGGRGDGARAITMLDAVRAADSAAVRSLATSTHASLLRQSGRHVDALVLDGAALSQMAVLLGAGDRRSTAIDVVAPWDRAAVVDAFVGLAADNLGRFAFAASDRLLARARAWLPPDAPVPLSDGWSTSARIRLRCEWVAAECHLYRGQPTAAATHAQAALAIVDAHPDATDRHRIKTRLIAAAVSAASGVSGARSAAAAATRCRDQANERGLLPLEWAACSLLDGLDPSGPNAARRDALRVELVRRGMPFA